MSNWKPKIKIVSEGVSATTKVICEGKEIPVTSVEIDRIDINSGIVTAKIGVEAALNVDLEVTEVVDETKLFEKDQEIESLQSQILDMKGEYVQARGSNNLISILNTQNEDLSRWIVQLRKENFHLKNPEILQRKLEKARETCVGKGDE